jgi:Histidine kinase-, DNA gyrase B-, and HSP90-like ATPase
VPLTGTAASSSRANHPHIGGVQFEVTRDTDRPGKLAIFEPLTERRANSALPGFRIDQLLHPRGISCPGSNLYKAEKNWRFLRAGRTVTVMVTILCPSPPKKDRFDINEAISDVIILTRGEAVKNGVSVQTQLADGLPLVEGDRVQLQQVILNLIINAIQAMTDVDARRDVQLSTVNVALEGTLVAVRDSGSGLKEGHLERLFEPFYTTKPDGLGMGLPICRSIIEAHGGRLWATPNEPRGAVFQFTLPPCRKD